MSIVLTPEQLEKALPKQLRRSIDQTLVDKVNSITDDPEYRDNYRDNLLSYTTVLKDGRFKIEAYFDAVKYITNKLLGKTNIEAYISTFPERYQYMLDHGYNSKDIASRVANYNGSKLVNMIYEQTLIPIHISNADKRQHAVNVLAELMITAKSEKVRQESANNLLTHLKMPETTKIELDMNVREDKSIQELRATTMELVAQQKEMLKAGAMNAREVAHSKLLIEDGEIVE